MVHRMLGIKVECRFCVFAHLICSLLRRINDVSLWARTHIRVHMRHSFAERLFIASWALGAAVALRIWRSCKPWILTPSAHTWTPRLHSRLLTPQTLTRPVSPTGDCIPTPCVSRIIQSEHFPHPEVRQPLPISSDGVRVRVSVFVNEVGIVPVEGCHKVRGAVRNWDQTMTGMVWGPIVLSSVSMYSACKKM